MASDKPTSLATCGGMLNESELQALFVQSNPSLDSDDYERGLDTVEEALQFIAMSQSCALVPPA